MHGLIACAPAKTTIMYNTKTGQTAECKRDPLKNWSWEEEKVVGRCVEQYRALGYLPANEVPKQ